MKYDHTMLCKETIPVQRQKEPFSKTLLIRRRLALSTILSQKKEKATMSVLSIFDSGINTLLAKLTILEKFNTVH